MSRDALVSYTFTDQIADSHIRVLRLSLGIFQPLLLGSVSSSLENQLMTELLRGISCGSVS